jgi:hypothetical protein
MSIHPFKSDAALKQFAKEFFRDRVGSFRKDVKICLTGNEKREHAYFPALITCIGFLDLLSGLHAGKVDGHGLKDLKKYAADFMSGKNYSPIHLTILYECFRHKIAHLSAPYLVFDTVTKANAFGGQGHQRRRITWTVYASRRSPPIGIIDYPTPQDFKRSLRPWPMSHNCRVKISVRSFQIDIVNSIYGPSGYLHDLKNDPVARERFARCMIHLYPPLTKTSQQQRP